MSRKKKKTPKQGSREEAEAFFEEILMHLTVLVLAEHTREPEDKTSAAIWAGHKASLRHSTVEALRECVLECADSDDPVIQFVCGLTPFVVENREGEGA